MAKTVLEPDTLDDASMPRREPVARRMVGTAGKLARIREAMLLAIILAGGVALTIASPYFLTFDTMLTILLAVSTESIVAIGMTILLVSGGFDLSVGATAAFSGAFTAMFIKSGMPVPAAIAAGLTIGAAIGVANGVIIAKVGINAFITTLAMMSIVRGTLLIVTKGQNISGLPESFKQIGQGNLLQVQYPIIIAVALVILGDVLLRTSRFFRQNYYIGGNEKAAMLSGIPVMGITIFNYALTGFLAALAGIVMTARFGSASVTTGEGMELTVITAVIIGGASLKGGEGTVFGAFLGCVLMAMIITALNLLEVPAYYNKFAIGATLLIAVLMDTLGKKFRRA